MSILRDTLKPLRYYMAIACTEAYHEASSEEAPLGERQSIDPSICKATKELKCDGKVKGPARSAMHKKEPKEHRQR